ncbi:MAG: hypothetical protein K6E20_06660 [Acholeplasmatales bacterium]|nr:hypothetical protein [Acholeplasmatales bacterium]
MAYKNQNYKKNAKKNKNKKNYDLQKSSGEETELDRLKKQYSNPTHSVPGKIIVGILAILMLCSGLLTLILILAMRGCN